MICIFGVGLYLSIRTGFCRSANFPTPCGQPSDESSANGEASDGALTPFQAVCLYHRPSEARLLSSRRSDRDQRSQRGLPGCVDFGIARNVHQICRSHACRSFPRAECTQRPCRRTDVLHQKRFVKKWHWLAVLFSIFGV